MKTRLSLTYKTNTMKNFFFFYFLVFIYYLFFLFIYIKGLAFRNLNSEASLFLSVIEPESLERAHWVIGDAGGALSVSFLRQQTLAANIVCPGASTLLSNLLRSETLHLVSTADEVSEWSTVVIVIVIFIS